MLFIIALGLGVGWAAGYVLRCLIRPRRIDAGSISDAWRAQHRGRKEP